MQMFTLLLNFDVCIFLNSSMFKFPLDSGFLISFHVRVLYHLQCSIRFVCDASRRPRDILLSYTKIEPMQIPESFKQKWEKVMPELMPTVSAKLNALHDPFSLLGSRWRSLKGTGKISAPLIPLGGSQLSPHWFPQILNFTMILHKSIFVSFEIRF